MCPPNIIVLIYWTSELSQRELAITQIGLVYFQYCQGEKIVLITICVPFTESLFMLKIYQIINISQGSQIAVCKLSKIVNLICK